jgi:hypothetical protein
MKSVRLPRIIDLLQRVGCTAPEVASKVYCTERSAQILINRLRQQGVVHIQEWRRSGNVWVAVYRYGIGTDAAKPKPLTAQERLKRWRAKESLDDHAFRMAKERAKKWKIKRDPLVAAFYGVENNKDLTGTS